MTGIKRDIQEVLNDPSHLKDHTAKISQDIATLQTRLPDYDPNGINYHLNRLFHNLSNYAESSFGRTSSQGPEDELQFSPIANISLYPSSSFSTAHSRLLAGADVEHLDDSNYVSTQGPAAPLDDQPSAQAQHIRATSPARLGQETTSIPTTDGDYGIDNSSVWSQLHAVTLPTPDLSTIAHLS